MFVKNILRKDVLDKKLEAVEYIKQQLSILSAKYPQGVFILKCISFQGSYYFYLKRDIKTKSSCVQIRISCHKKKGGFENNNQRRYELIFNNAQIPDYKKIWYKIIKKYFQQST